MEDVAHEAGVSRALVSLVMRAQPNVSEERRSRVLDAANRLGYRPNAMARSLASRRTKTVGVILDDLRNPFFAEIAGGIEELASELGYQVLLGAGGRQARRERASLATLLEYRVDGVILVSPRMRTSDIAAAAAEVPVVMVGRQVRGVDADLVIIDENLGTQLVLDHLIGLGHERIAHVDGGTGAGGPQRKSAFLRWMRAHRLGARARVIPGDFTEEAGAAAARALLAEPELPTAVFAANDMVAAGLLGGFDQAGVEVPGACLDRGLRQQLHRPSRPRRPDHGRPAAHRDGEDGARAPAGPDRQPARQGGAPGRALAGGPLDHRAAPGVAALTAPPRAQRRT